MVSQEHIPESGLARAKAHIKSTSVAKAILEEGGEKGKKGGSGPFLAPFKPQISPQLSRNSCLFQSLRSTGREVQQHTHTQEGEREKRETEHICSF